MTAQLSRGDATVSPLGEYAASALVHLGSLAPEVSGAWSPAPAPEGTWVAFVSDRGGSPQVWIQPVDGVGAVLVDTGPQPAVSVHWSPDGAWLACEIAPGGAPRTEVWLVRPDGRDLHQVAGFGRTTASDLRWLPGPATLALTETGADSCGVLVRPGGTRTVVAQGSLLSLLDVAPAGDRLLLCRGGRAVRRLTVLDLATGVERPLLTGAGSTDAGRFAPDGRAVYARTDVGSELARLVRVPIDDPSAAVTVAARADAELESFDLSLDGSTAALVWNVYGGMGEVTLLDPRTGRQRRVDLPASATVVEACAFAAGGATLAITVEGPAEPRGVHVLTRTGELTRVTPHDRDLSAAVVPELHSLSSVDGLVITGWLYRPAGPGPHPTVLSLHSGPEWQARPGYNPLFQSLVNLGVAVFAPNVRGSSGFGRTFVNADNGPARYGAIADVAAAVSYLVGAGLADPARVGCMGRSYGGYLTLAALVTYPELFAVGIDVCGMANFATFYANAEPWIAAEAVSKYGHPEHDRELLRDLSPITRIDRLTAPLLVVHGANDTNVPRCEAEQVVAALRVNGVPHRFLLFDGEGHDFLSRASREAYLVAAVAWLAHHLDVAGSGLLRAS